jgi:tetratricopeptide (TPR) repeat protein
VEGIKYWNQQDWAQAAECFQKALEMDPNRPVIRDNLRRAKELLAEQKRQQEETRLMDEANRKVNRMLRDVGTALDGSKDGGAAPLPTGSARTVPPANNSLDFMESREPLYSKGSQTSAPVNFQRADPGDLPVVEPRVVKGQMTPEEARAAREREAQIQVAKESANAAVAKRDFPSAINHLKAALQLRPDDRNIQMALGAVLHAKDMQEGRRVTNPKVEAILDAFEFGRGDWVKSLGYLQETCRANPNQLGCRAAFAFVQGMSGYFPEPSIGNNTATTDNPLDAEMKALLAKAAANAASGNYEVAVACYEQAVHRDPNNLAIRDLLHFTEGRSARQATGGKRSGPFDPTPEDSKGLLPAVSGQAGGKSK